MPTLFEMFNATRGPPPGTLREDSQEPDPLANPGGGNDAAAGNGADNEPPPADDDDDPPPPPPPTRTRRRPRSDSLTNDLDMTLSAPATKRLKEYATAVCTEKGIPEDNDELLKFVLLAMSLPKMLIDIKADLVRLNCLSIDEQLRKQFESKTFQEMLSVRIQVCLNSPNLPGYVIGAGAFFRNLLTHPKCPEMLGIPQAMLDIPEVVEGLGDLIISKLSNMRGNFRTRINTSITDALPITTYSRIMVGASNTNITTNHWKRCAFLRTAAVLFTLVLSNQTEALAARIARGEVVTQAEKDEQSKPADNRVSTFEEPDIWRSAEYWRFVDVSLYQMRTNARKEHPGDKAGQLNFINKFMNQKLHQDQIDYPTDIAERKPENVKYTLLKTRGWQETILNEVI